mgnify:CR=1 FL=1
MKKKIIIISIIIALVILIPISNKLRDGGSIEYRSLVYKITKIHRLNELSVTGYEEGWIIEILGFEIYNNVYIPISRANLQKIQDELTDKVISIDDYGNFAGCGPDEKGKFIIVELVDNSKKEQKWFRENIYDSPYIKFKRGGPNYLC